MKLAENEVVVAEFDKGCIVAVTSGLCMGHRWVPNEPIYPKGTKIATGPMPDLDYSSVRAKWGFENKELQK